MKQASKHDWLLLIHQLPPKPTNLRVRVWRKLQKLGAITIKNSIYVLPANDKTREDFQWLRKEIESAGGESSVFQAASVEGATDEEIIEVFRKTRAAEFAAITADFDGLAGAVIQQARGKHQSPGRLAAHEAELDKLRAQLEGIITNDFFKADGRNAALTAYERCQKALEAWQRPAHKPAGRIAKAGLLDPANYQGRRWVTRRNLHIDRLACAWLIRQFIDKRPRFYFVEEGDNLAGAIPFDMFEAEFTHQGEACTFETLLKRFGLEGSKGLSEMAEIVHDIDLKDDKFHRLEANGINAVINGLSANLRNDRKLLQQAGVIFDGLYSLLSQKQTNRKLKSAAGSKRSKRR